MSDQYLYLYTAVATSSKNFLVDLLMSPDVFTSLYGFALMFVILMYMYRLFVKNYD